MASRSRDEHTTIAKRMYKSRSKFWSPQRATSARYLDSARAHAHSFYGGGGGGGGDRGRKGENGEKGGREERRRNARKMEENQYGHDHQIVLSYVVTEMQSCAHGIISH